MVEAQRRWGGMAQVVVGKPCPSSLRKTNTMKNWKHMALVAALIGLSPATHAQGGAQRNMHKYGATAGQQAGSGSHQGSGAGQGGQKHGQSHSRDASQIGGEDALRDRMRVHTPTTSTVTQ